MTRRRALWIVSVSNMAGVARHVLDVARTGIEGWDLCYVVPEGPLARELEQLGAAVKTAGFGRDLGTVSSLRALRAATREWSPDLLHSHLAWADLLTAAASPRGAVVVSTEHGVAGVPHLYNRTRRAAAFKRQLHRRRMRRTDAMIPVSRATAEVARSLWGLPRGLVQVIHNGVDRLPAHAWDGHAGTRFGCFARLAPEKDFATVLTAFGQVRRQLPEATLDIAGSGPLEHWLEDELARRDLTPAARLRGFMPPAEFFSEVDVVVQLSLWENCSYSILDSVVRGKGVVTSSVGGYLEYLPERCLVRTGDAGAAAERMRQQATSPALRPALPADWPSVSEMTTGIAEVYARVTELSATRARDGGRR
jgi:glycosyltransferase involved in cell wall biosynthesis